MSDYFKVYKAIEQRSGQAVDNLFDLLDEQGNVIALDEQGQITGKFSDKDAGRNRGPDAFETAYEPARGIDKGNSYAGDAADMIPLKEWARLNGISAATARQKAGRGGLKTARKVGRDWMIDRNEANPDNRTKKVISVPANGFGPRHILGYLKLIDGNSKIETWKNIKAHREYCRKVFFSLRNSFSGNPGIMFDLISDAIGDSPEKEVYYIAHDQLVEALDDEAFMTGDGEILDFKDYLKALSNIVHDLLGHTIDLDLDRSGQSICLSWYRSLIWTRSQDGGIYFVPTDFFRLIVAGLR